MKRILGRLISLILSLCLLASLIPVSPAHSSEKEARDITSEVTMTTSGGVYYPKSLRDKNQKNSVTIEEGNWVTLEHVDGFSSLYIIFHMAYEGHTITNNNTGAVHTLGENQFLHEFVDLEDIFGSAPTSITLSFPTGKAQLREIYVFTAGEVPSFVQKWEIPDDGKTDLVLFSTHGDDEQLFFAGLLPYYAGELGYQVQVCYLTDHRNADPRRIHEMLNGLWAVGVTTYPVFGEFYDFRVDSLEETYDRFAIQGWSREYLLGFVVEQLRRFKPLVAVGHDIYGEYGHGQHMVYTDLLIDALQISSDPSQYPESAEKYGLWDVPKTYLHLYWENQIVMDWDRPLEKFNGMTAFEVTKYLGFPCHESQQEAYGYYFRTSRTCAEVHEYSPAEYGLFRTTVGDDILKNDFFENLTTYAEQERLAEEARLAEESRRRADEEAKLKEEAEKSAQLEAQRLAADEAARLAEAEAARLAAQELALLQQRQKIISENILICCYIAVAVLIITCLLFFIRKHRNGSENRPKNNF